MPALFISQKNVTYNPIKWTITGTRLSLEELQYFFLHMHSRTANELGQLTQVGLGTEGPTVATIVLENSTVSPNHHLQQSSTLRGYS